ncbi:MAG: hypothetical protein Q4P65_01290 [Eubacteriales bacterium]|nr:hypothetical protein [Eubacteriales bacterium]
MNIIVRRSLAITLALLTLFSLTACKQGATKSEIAEHADGRVTEAENAQSDSERTQLNDLKTEGFCTVGTREERVYQAPEEVPALSSNELSVADYEQGYRCNHNMGYCYYLPKIWRELQYLIMSDRVGNPRFEEEAVANGRYYYYVLPSTAVALDDLSNIDMPDEEKAYRLEELLAERIPLFGILLFRNEKLPESLTERAAPREFTKRKILNAGDNYTLVVANAPYQPELVGEAFLDDYKMAYEARETIINSMNFFEPEAEDELVIAHASLDFPIYDLNSGKQVKKIKDSYLLVFNDLRSSERNYLELLDKKVDKLIAMPSLVQNKLDEEDRSRLLAYKAKSGGKYELCVADREGQIKLLQYLGYSPALLKIAKDGSIEAVYYGIKSETELADIVLK